MARGVMAEGRATVDDPRWAQVVARDAAADGQFWYCVVTAGVYCRPSCPSRRANPANVTLHDSIAAARATGCRACQRCHPDAASAGAERTRLVARACRAISDDVQGWSLAELARDAGLGLRQFHRIFKDVTGLTPHQYGAGEQAARLRGGLARGAPVTAAFHVAGFNSSGRFYEKLNAMLGMTPRAFRAGGVDEELRFAVGQCALGAILVACSAKGVASILLGDDPAALLGELQQRFARARLVGADHRFEQIIARLVAFVEAPAIGLDLPLDVRGTAFQHRVWLALQQIPAGCTITYRELAHRIGASAAVRAVAGARAANPIALAIPCHRVVRSDGALSGYAWGVARKREMLAREATGVSKIAV